MSKDDTLLAAVEGAGEKKSKKSKDKKRERKEENAVDEVEEKRLGVDAAGKGACRPCFKRSHLFTSGGRKGEKKEKGQEGEGYA